MKLYIELETHGDKMDVCAIEDALRQIIRINAEAGFDYIQASDKDAQRIVFCYAYANNRLFDGVVTAAMVNKITSAK